nr:nose resistant to fluoxetine protein 6-like [Pocillopora verrucosa]
MVGISPTKTAMEFIAIFFAFALLNTCSCASPGFVLENYSQLAQKFGFPSLPPLPIKFNFSDISKECQDTVANLLQLPVAYSYVDAIGKPQSGLFLGNTGWLGSYSECTETIPDAHYCLAYLSFTQPPLNITKLFPVRWGICAPKQCSEEDVTRGLQDVFTGINNYANKTEVVLRPGAQPLPGQDANGKSVYCSKKSEYTTGAILTLILCGLILFLCLFGTILDIVISFMKRPSVPVSKTSGFMPIRDDSLPILQGQGSDSFAQSHQSSVHPPSDEIIGSSTRLTSFPYQKNEPNVIVQFFLCFSLIQNTSRIMDTKVPASAVTSINGMRVMSMWWVILGHVYAFQLGSSISNFVLFFQLLQRFTFEAIGNATFSVDSFFFLSGLLVSYLSLRHMEKKNGQLPLFKYYFHRFWRLTPAYMFVLLFYDKLNGFLGDGPFWYQAQEKNPCDKYWWTNLLYINNFYPTSFGASCFDWSWYLANDMQFYIIAPAVLFVAYRFRLRGLIVFVALLLGISFTTTAVIYAHYDLPAVIISKAALDAAGRGVDSMSLTYVKPYCRISPYLVGIVTGYLLLHVKDWRLSTKVQTYLFNMAGWCVAIVLALSTLYGQYKALRKDNPVQFSRAENIIYGTFSRFAWSLALAWVIFACHNGLGGLVNKFLSARFWIPLSRLTYCAYLVHPIIIFVLFQSYETVRAYSDVHIAFCFVGVLGISYAVAFIVSVCVEYPMMQLEKFIFKSDN